MENLDSNYIDPVTVSPRPIGMRWGFIWGCISALTSILFSVTGMSIPGKTSALSFLPLIIAIVVSATCCYMAVKQHRDNDLGGYITLGRSVTVGFWAGLISGIIGGIAAYLTLKFITPDLMNQAIENAASAAEEKGQDGEKVREMMGKMGFMFSPVIAIFSGIVWGILCGIVLGLVNGLILKKESPRGF